MYIYIYIYIYIYDIYYILDISYMTYDIYYMILNVELRFSNSRYKVSLTWDSNP